MGKSINLKIDNQPVTVPEGTLIVDAAKKIGIDIPVFCYHPKLKPVGMCRMCLVDVGRPMIDRATGQPLLEPDGAPRLQFGPKLETACTTPVSEGMRVVTDSPKVKEARTGVVECLLTSHPLDCPICDKGGECPLQNLTMAHGSGQSRFIFDEKMHMAKNVPLGELIFLDRERCIQCGRCTRFQHELVDDAVIAFHARGRSLEIVTDSEPGFDSIWSGNTTDICPVGALTTADFRFGARIWEMNSAASLCNQCPVGCNITFNVRREAHSNGQIVIKRVMPRQNEAVNETWICDKGRFGYHYAESPDRLRRPLIRRNGQLEAASWDEALDLIAEKITSAGSGLMTLAGGRLSNEDLFNLRQLNRNGANLLDTFMGGGDLVDQVGLAQGSNLANLGKGSVILVVASDLHQEAPLWWLRIKQASERGATLIVANPRPTRLDRFATHRVRYAYGDEAATIAAFMPGSSLDTQYAIRNTDSILAAAKALASAENAIILFGSDGLGLSGSTALAQACAALLVATGHVGKPNNGLVGVWPNGNTQGAWDMGFHPSEDLGAALGKALVAYIVASDPAGDDPALALAVDRAAFVVVQDLFLTETAKLADVVLPAVPYTEREGTYTSGERRVQRFYPAVPAQPGPRADFAIFAQLGNRLNLTLEGRAPALIFNQIAATCPAYAGLTYQKLGEMVEQWPLVGRSDLYYGGTTYDNRQGIGVQLVPCAQCGEAVNLPLPVLPAKLEVPPEALVLLPVTRLYDRGTLLAPSKLLDQRVAEAALWLHPETAAAQGLIAGAQITITLSGHTYPVKIVTDETVPTGVALVPRSVGLPVSQPQVLMLQAVD
jgi:NADH-quinone oxidoreductase subunit G